ncbi:MAG: CHRD domain-containing protein [Woeseiaceae bacterium]|nr:CHRD domain-containing protein [Woeseiaceae bacterium]
MIIRNLSPSSPIARFLIVLATVAVAACGGGGSGGSTTAPPPPAADVITEYSVTLDAASIVSGSGEAGTATAIVRHNSTEETIEISVTLTSVTADSVSFRRAHAGDRGIEIYSLQQGASADDWVLSSQPFTATDVSDLLAGKLYLLVATAGSPDGALRGQVLPQGVEIIRIGLSPDDVTVGSTSIGSGAAWLTINHNDSSVTAHAWLQNLLDANSGFLRRALAGTNGPVLETLVQDPTSAAHWSLDTKDVSTELLAALSDGELYAEFTTPALAAGAIRGQHIPAGMELVRTDVRDDTVVLNAFSGPFTGIVGRVMTTIDDNSLTSILNLFDIQGSTSAELRQAPAGQVGPVLASFESDLSDSNRWTLTDVEIDDAVRANLDNRTLYVSVATPAAPNGAARGQIETSASSPPADASAFVATMIDPPNAERLDQLPDMVFVTLNREPLPASVTPRVVAVEASGMDGSFGDGNETPIIPASVTANGNAIEISLAGAQAVDDVYRVSLTGGGTDGVLDMSGIALDGDNDGQPGGIFMSAFEVEKPVITATLTEIQNDIFTPSCATAGCHSGSSPPDGLLLTAGEAWSNIVNVDAVQVNLKRVKPGDPDNSYLVRKVEGNGIVANRMPLGAPPLSQEQIDLIRQWVLNGAEDN